MLDRVREMMSGKRIVIVGFGLEGRSTFRFLREHVGNIPLAIADRDTKIASNTEHEPGMERVEWILGPGYLDRLGRYDLLIRSPGIALPAAFRPSHPEMVITSQAALVLAEYHRQIIGITGTKGKSTTSSLIHYILKSAGKKSILVGNIGKPPLDSILEAGPDSVLVYELSSHQLEDITRSPHISILLNLFPEHLDRYASTAEYYRAKWNIFMHRNPSDILIINNSISSDHLPGKEIIGMGGVLTFGIGKSSGQGCYLESEKVVLYDNQCEEECCTLGPELYLKGRHNRLNMMAAILACRQEGATMEEIMEGIRTFRGLEHRLEYVGCFGGIHFYNDSIATIPEATMEAVRAIPDVDTLLLGGYDRGLEYDELVNFLMASPVRNLVFMGRAGERMMGLASRHPLRPGHHLIKAAGMEEAFKIIPGITRAGSVCLLSPAAASYDLYKNFEERGQLFKKTARNL
jgi:UDP-N-acetylmuramoylalanine--D-glutamate ligase